MSTKAIRSLREKFYNSCNIEENKKIENIVNYIDSFNYPGNVKNDILLDVLSMLNDGLENGQNFDEIIGENHREFVDEIFENINKKPYIINPKVFYLIITLPLVDVLMLFFENGIVWEARLSFFKLFTFTILGIIMYYYEYYSKHSVYDEKMKFRILIVTVILIIFTAFCMRYIENRIGFKISAMYYIFFSATAFTLRFILNKIENNRGGL